jgi:hypothetical protein
VLVPPDVEPRQRGAVYVATALRVVEAPVVHGGVALQGLVAWGIFERLKPVTIKEVPQESKGSWVVGYEEQVSMELVEGVWV